MHLVIFSSSDKFTSEVYIINVLFKNGLKTLHLKKPNFSKNKLKNYISKIDKKYHNRIIIHSHYSLSLKFNLKGIHISKLLLGKKIKYRLITNFYKLLDKNFIFTRTFTKKDDLSKISPIFSYVFLAPIYTKQENKARNYNFEKSYLKNIIHDSSIDIYARGGINIDDFKELNNLNFKGISLLKTIWYNKTQPLDEFLSAKDKIKKLNEIPI